MPDVEHVVVLMLENRSYDHMLGLLSTDPKYNGVEVGNDKFSNTYRLPTGEVLQVGVSADGNPSLTVDPPHSHNSARIQLGVDVGPKPTMSGFIKAYARAVRAVASGGESDPAEINKFRIIVAAALAPLAIGALLGLPRPWGLVAGAVALEAMLLFATLGLQRELEPTLPFKKWKLVYFFTPVAIAALAVGAWFLSPGAAYLTRLVIIAAVVFAIGGIGFLALRRKYPPPDVDSKYAERIMACMAPEQVPVLARLARSFTVCTKWHCSVPGATWPNRNFAHAGTSDGTTDIQLGLYKNPTIFERLGSNAWRIYRDPESVAQVMVFSALWDDDPNRRNWREFGDFLDEVKRGDLPAYSFIEPCHDGVRSNSQHPGNNDFDAPIADDALTDFRRGERLIADVYEALRTNTTRLFEKTLLLITYDEHGGFYDHEPPPTIAVPPSPTKARKDSWSQQLIRLFVRQPPVTFDFTILGPRVPAVVVGGCVPSSTTDTIFDHSSIPKTLRTLFAPQAAKLTDREDVANTFHQLASLPQVRTTDVPDLSGYTTPVVAPFGPLADVADTPIPKPRDDEFTREIRRLALAVNARIRDKSVDFAPQADIAPSNETIGSNFTAFTRQA